VKAGITLVLGGARSGKSEVAERLALAFDPPVTYVATGSAPAGDEDWARRVERHRGRRPPDWLTVEVEPSDDLGSVLTLVTGGVLLDSVGTWLAGRPDLGAGGAEADAFRDGLVARRSAGYPTIVVSEEVGLGVHPSSSVGRIFRDALGTVNRQIADVADAVLLVVAGRVLALGESKEA
jgi:adenosylcobinamide kinase/adenosylcobinamide-phosphate guanylyltransferase